MESLRDDDEGGDEDGEEQVQHEQPAQEVEVGTHCWTEMTLDLTDRLVPELEGKYYITTAVADLEMNMIISYIVIVIFIISVYLSNITVIVNLCTATAVHRLSLSVG